MSGYSIVCSGQGGLGIDTLAFSKPFLSASRIIDLFSSEFGWDLFSVENGSLDLRLNKFSQPLTIASSVANWEVLKEYLPAPNFFMGYSAGELSALGCAQENNPLLITKLAYLRCKAMEEFSLDASGMLAIKGIGKSALLKVIGGANLYIAIINDEDHFIVGGFDSDLSSLEKLLLTHGTWCKRLLVSVPSHTPLLEGASLQFLTEASSLSFIKNQLAAPLIQGINGKTSVDIKDSIKSIGYGISQTINWQQCMQFVIDSGVNLILELGPGNSLAKMFTEFHPSISARSVSDFRTPEGVRGWLLSELEN